MTEGESPLPDPKVEEGPEPAAPERKKRSGGGALVFAAVVLVGAVAVWSTLGQRSRPVLPGAEPMASDAPATPRPGKRELSAANSPESAAALAALQQRIAHLEQQRSAAVVNGPLQEAAAGALDTRVQKIEAMMAALPSDVETVGGELVERVASLEQRLANLEARASLDAKSGHRAASLAFALGHLRAAVLEGRPYGPELERVSGLAAGAMGQDGPDDPWARIVALAGQIRGHAADGVPTPASLRHDFGASARAILSAEPDGRTGDWTENLRAGLASVVTVRRTGERVGDDPEASVARAEMRLGEGNLAAAVQELAVLDGAAATAAAPWIAAAQSRLSAEQVLRDLEAAGADVIAGVGSGAVTRPGTDLDIGPAATPPKAG